MSDGDDLLDATSVDRLVRIGGTKLARQMIELFLQHGPERIGAAESGYASMNLRQVEHATHSLKSSAGNVGAVRLQAAAAAVEAAAEPPTAASPGGRGDIEVLLATLRVEYDAAVTALTERLGKLTE